MNDEFKLIKQAQKGSEEAFASLLDAQYDRIYRFAYKWCGKTEDAEDITQQACIKLARTIEQFNFESAFTSWLYRLVINCAKDWYRSQSRHVSANLEEQQECAGSSSEGDSSIYLHQILNLLDQLSDGFKDTALLVLAEGFSHKEAAEVLGVKESTVSWRIHEIRKQLKAFQKKGLI